MHEFEVGVAKITLGNSPVEYALWLHVRTYLGTFIDVVALLLVISTSYQTVLYKSMMQDENGLVRGRDKALVVVWNSQSQFPAITWDQVIWWVNLKHRL